MALDASEVRVFQDGNVYTAPVGSTFPDGIAIPIAPWVDLGYLDTAGPQFSFSTDTTDIMAWQSLDPVRTVVTGRPKEITLPLIQTNFDTFTLAMGGGDIESLGGATPDVYEYTPAESSYVDERALIVDGRDGDYTIRFLFPRVLLQGGASFAFTRDSAVNFEVTVKVLTPTSGDTFVVRSDHPALAPA